MLSLTQSVVRARTRWLMVGALNCSEAVTGLSEVGVTRSMCCFFFFQAEDGIRDVAVTGVQTCALPISVPPGIEGTVVDVKVFSRRGVDKDERAKSIEEEEIGRLEKDYQDEIAMVEMERDQKLKNLLVGKTALNELFDPTNKVRRVTKKSDRIERPDLDNFSWNELKKIKVKEDEGLAQMVRRIEELAEEQIGIYDSMLEDRIGRLRRGDDLPPGVIKMVKVYVAVKRKLSVGDKMAGRHGNKGAAPKV